MQVLVARIGKPHGIRGEVTVQLFTDIPEERFAPGEVLDLERGIVGIRRFWWYVLRKSLPATKRKSCGAAA